MLSNNDEEMAKASDALAEGLNRICLDTKVLPREFSASFLLYRLKVDPEVVSKDLCLIVQRAIETFNSSQKRYLASHNVDGPDVIITIRFPEK